MSKMRTLFCLVDIKKAFIFNLFCVLISFIARLKFFFFIDVFEYTPCVHF